MANRNLRSIGVLILILAVGAFASVGFYWRCRQGFEQRSKWPTLANANDAGFASLGWIPGGVPAGATEISEWHDLDSSDFCGVFELKKQSLPRFENIAVPLKRGACPPNLDARLELITHPAVISLECDEYSGKGAVVVFDDESSIGAFWSLRNCTTRSGE